MARLQQTSDRLGMKAAEHAEKYWGIKANYHSMKSKTPLRTMSKQSPIPLGGFDSPILQPNIEEDSVQEIEGEGLGGEGQGEEQQVQGQMADEEEEEVDPRELVPATGALIVRVFVTEYLEKYKCGVINWVPYGFA